MFINKRETTGRISVGNCIVGTEAERNELMNDIFNKKVDGYWIEVQGEVIKAPKLMDILKLVAGNPEIKADVEINHKYGIWGTVGSIREYTPRKFKNKYGNI